MITKKLLLLE